MTMQRPSPDTPCTQLSHRKRANPAHRCRPDRHGIVAPGHKIAAVLIKSDRCRPGAPRGAGGSTS